MAKRKRRSRKLYLPMDYLPAGSELWLEFGDILVVDEKGRNLQWETDKLRKVARFYDEVVFTEKEPDE